MTRYAITHINEHGHRVLTLINRGQYHYDTMTEATIRLLEIYGRPTLIAQLGAEGHATLEVTPVSCDEYGRVKEPYTCLECAAKKVPHHG